MVPPIAVVLKRVEHLGLVLEGTAMAAFEDGNEAHNRRGEWHLSI